MISPHDANSGTVVLHCTRCQRPVRWQVPERRRWFLRASGKSLLPIVQQTSDLAAIVLQQGREIPYSFMFEVQMFDYDQAALLASTLATFACVFGVLSVFLLVR